MMNIKAGDQEFIDKAKTFTQRMGESAVLLLVGSQAAGFHDSWSDLDMWVIGDKSNLTREETGRYEKDGELFVDRGDLEAHWKFFDSGDFRVTLHDWPAEIMWILLTSEVIFDNDATADSLKRLCQDYPRNIVEKKLKCQFGNYWHLLGPLNMAGRRKPETAFLIAGKTIEHLCKVCCLAECKPFPYTKWLVSVARQTSIGNRLFPYIRRMASTSVNWLP